MDRPHADDRACDGVRRAHRDTRRRCTEQCDRPSSLSAEAAHRLQLGDLRSHGVHYLPPTEVRAHGNGQVRADQNWPMIDAPTALHLSRGDEVARIKRAGYDAHRLLRIIAAMSQAV